MYKIYIRYRLALPVVPTIADLIIEKVTTVPVAQILPTVVIKEPRCVSCRGVLSFACKQLSVDICSAQQNVLKQAKKLSLLKRKVIEGCNACTMYICRYLNECIFILFFSLSKRHLCFGLVFLHLQNRHFSFVWRSFT